MLGAKRRPAATSAKVFAVCADYLGMASATPFPFAYRPTPDELVRQLKHFPSAPRVLPRLKRLLADANSSMAEVVSFIRLDPGIAARVLQMGNSAYFSGGHHCYTIDEAVHRVGYSQIYELVSYAVASQVLVRPLATYGLEADELWQRSVACALAAELIAAKAGVDHNLAYTTGLLHSVGMVAIDEWVFQNHPHEQISFATRGFPQEAIADERAQLGCNQAEAGAALLRLWEFPVAMTEPVRWQYLPRATAGHLRESCLLHAAKWLRTCACAPHLVPPAPPDATVLLPLQLTRAHLEKLLPEVRSRLATISSLLQVDEPSGSEVPFPGGTRFVADGLRGPAFA